MNIKELYQKILFIITGGISLSFFIEIFLNLPQFVFPYNLWLVVLLLIFTFFIYYFFREKQIFIILSSVHTAIASLLFYIVFLIISGFVPQVKDNTLLTTIGLTHIVSSIPFTFLTLLLVINLLFALWKRIFLPLSIKNVTFIINHLGILIVLLFGSIAAFDLIRTTMYIEKNKVIWYSFNDNNKDVVQLPFAIELKDFDIDYFEPNIQLLKIKDISNNKLDLISQVSVDKNKILKLKDFEIKIHRIIDYAWFIEDTVYTNYSPGYTKAVYVTIKRKNQMINSWLSFPTFVQNARYVRIGDYVLMLSTPQPKKYVSYVKVYEKSGRVYDDSILVNHPLDIEGWKVYQKDYDQNLGEFSNISILEVNHDRWLSIVYFGIYMMIIGSILLLITSRRKNVSNI